MTHGRRGLGWDGPPALLRSAHRRAGEGNRGFGNVTFSDNLSEYTPDELSNTNAAVIAPFWADVDTRASGSEPVRYGWGSTTYEGRPALCVSWLDVGLTTDPSPSATAG